MLSVSKIKNSKGASHYFAKDDYYAKDDPSHQQLSGWHGKGAKILNLSGQVNPKIFEKILAGNLPNGKQIGLIKDGDFIHDSGRDLTFSAPKSVSIMALIYNDKRLVQAHKIAVKSALNEIEKNYLKTRIKQDGITNTITTNNLIAATFEHHTSRNLDPQLHTHCVIANATRDDNGKWKSAFLMIFTIQQKTRTGHFEKGNILLWSKNRDYLNIKKNDYCQIINIEAKTNQLIVKNLKTEKLTAFNPKQIKGKADKIYFEVFTKKSRNFKEGDKIAFTRSIEDLKILNSSQGTINHLDNNQISITLEDGRKINLNHNSNANKHLDHSYAITTHKAQGLTCNNVIAIVDSTRKNLTNQKNFYVEISRAKERAIIVTDDKTKSINQIKKDVGFDLNAKEHQNLKDHQQKINQHHQISRQQNHHQPKQPQIHHQPQPTHQSKGMDFSL